MNGVILFYLFRIIPEVKQHEDVGILLKKMLVISKFVCGGNRYFHDFVIIDCAKLVPQIRVLSLEYGHFSVHPVLTVDC